MQPDHTASHGSTRERITQKAALVSACVVLCSGLAVIAGWLADIPMLKSILPQWVTMKFNTALSLTLAGAALAALASDRAGGPLRRAAAPMGLAVAALGLATLLQYILGVDLGIDQFFIREGAGAVATSSPGRMSPLTAINFTLAGASLALLAAGGQLPKAARWMTLAVAFLSAGALFGYLYGTGHIYLLDKYTSMAAHTSLLFILLALGIACSDRESPFIGLLFSRTAAGLFARVTLPVMSAGFLFIGWLRLYGEKAGFYGAETGVTISALFAVFAAGLVVYFPAKAACRSEEKALGLLAAVKTSEAALSAVVNGTASLIYLKDAQGRFTLVNKALEKAQGLPADRMLGKTVYDFLPENIAAALAANDARVMSSGETVEAEEKSVMGDGLAHTFISVKTPVKDPAGRPVALAGVSTDITERKKTEEELAAAGARLAEANRELEAFSYSVSHDLRAPLRAVEGFSKILLEDYGPRLDAEGLRLIGVVRENTRRMSRLIDDLLAFSRVSRAGISKETVDMRALALEAWEALAPERAAPRFELGELPPASGDRAMLRQVWMNLVSNAVKFSRGAAAPEIKINGAAEGAFNVYAVADNGAGFDPAYSNKLFGVFQRLHSEEEFEGNGVGLAMVQRITARHGGRVWAEGEPGHGAVFQFALPAPEKIE